MAKGATHTEDIDETEAYRLRRWEAWTLAADDKLDKVLSRLAQRYAEVSIPKQMFSELADFDRAALDFYCRQQYSKRPHRFYRPPRAVPKVKFSDEWGLSHGTVRTATFESTFRPTFPGCHLNDTNCNGGRTVAVRYWKHPEQTSLGTIIAIHGWQMADRRLSSVSLAPGFFFKQGLDVIVYEMPYHGTRQQFIEGHPVYFPSSDLARTAEGFAQSIFELRQIRKWLTANSPKPVGVVGVSLGGYVSALWSSLDKLDFVIAISPLADLLEFARVYVREQQFEETRRLDIESFLSLTELIDACAVHNPRSYTPKVEHGARLLLASKEDQVVPREQVLSLWEHWGQPQLHWLDGGHFGQMFAQDAMNHVHQFLLPLRLAHPSPLQIHSSLNP